MILLLRRNLPCPLESTAPHKSKFFKTSLPCPSKRKKNKNKNKNSNTKVLLLYTPLEIGLTVYIQLFELLGVKINTLNTSSNNYSLFLAFYIIAVCKLTALYDINAHWWHSHSITWHVFMNVWRDFIKMLNFHFHVPKWFSGTFKCLNYCNKAKRFSDTWKLCS